MNKIIAYKPFTTGIMPGWDSFFEDFFESNLDTEFRKPAVDIVEKEGSYSFDVELPGFNEKEIDVRLEKNILTVKAEKEVKEEEKGKDKTIISERKEKYYRSFVLPENADGEKIEAKFENGLLALDIAKKEKEAPKKIEIKK